MPRNNRQKTRFTGVYWTTIETPVGADEVFYIRYSKKVQKSDGTWGRKSIEEKVGGAYADDMTAAKAAKIRDRRILGLEKNNTEERAAREAQEVYALRNAFEDWAKWNKPKSERAEHNRFKRVFSNEERNRSVTLFGEKDAIAIRNRMAEKGLSPDTIRLALAQLRLLLRFAAKQKKRPWPDFEFHTPKGRVHRDDMGQEAMARYVRVLNEIISGSGKHKTADHRLVEAAVICKFALATGLRAGSIFDLCWKDVHLEKRWIYLRDPKGGEPQTTPLNEVAVEILMGRQRGEDEAYVFPGRRGGRLQSIAASSRKIRELAGLPKDFKPLHGLRNTVGATLTSNNVGMHAISGLFGHSSTDVTEEHYAHLRFGPIREAADEMARQIRIAEGGGLMEPDVFDEIKKQILSKVAALQPESDGPLLHALRVILLD